MGAALYHTTTAIANGCQLSKLCGAEGRESHTGSPAFLFVLTQLQDWAACSCIPCSCASSQNYFSGCRPAPRHTSRKPCPRPDPTFGGPRFAGSAPNQTYHTNTHHHTARCILPDHPHTPTQTRQTTQATFLWHKATTQPPHLQANAPSPSIPRPSHPPRPLIPRPRPQQPSPRASQNDHH